MGVNKQFDVKKYKKAIDFSYSFYQSKYRKGMKIPYFTYLSSVSNLIIENNGNTDEAIAGLLHDLLEFDNNKKKTSLVKSRFGIKVLNIIKQCSNTPNKSAVNNDWILSKKKFLENMSKKSQSTLLVSICDKLHSLNCIISDYNKIGKKLWKNYEHSKDDNLWYYKNLCKNFKKYLKNHKNLKDRFQRNVNELEYFTKK
jgi:(p)ppGpp synthase/HD superfamily hydrolase